MDTSNEPFIKKERAPIRKISLTVAAIYVIIFLTVFINPFEVFGHPYPGLHGLIVICMITSIFVVAILLNIRRETYAIYRDRLVRTPLNGPEVVYPFSELQGWEERIDDENELSGVVLSFPDRAIFIDGAGDARLLIDHLTAAGYPAHRDIPYHRRQDILTIVVVIIILVVPFWLSRWHPILTHREAIKGKETITLHRMKIEINPYIYRYRAGNDHIGEMQFTIKDLDDYVFFIPNEKAVNSYMSTTDFSETRYDTVDIELLRYDYEVKIAHTRQPSFWDKYFDWDRIHMLRVRFTDVEIVSDQDWIIESGDSSRPD